MRTAFFDLLFEEMKKDQDIFLIIADMGKGIFEKFVEHFPDRYLNVGIAEQNMIGIAAGLCNVGFRPFCYTISNFITQRCFEQIRDDICIPFSPVTLIGTSTGFDNGTSGPTHYPIDDIGVMKVLPGMRIYSPSTVESIAPSFNDIVSNAAPAYIRIGKGSPSIGMLVDECDYYVNKNDAAKTLIIMHGNVISHVLPIIRDIENDCSLLCVNKLKPIDDDLLKHAIEKHENLIIIEDQFASSGLYNILCQLIIENSVRFSKIISISPEEEYPKTIGSPSYFADLYGYSSKKILDTIYSLR